MAKQDLELPYPHKCIKKTYVHVEEFSLKTGDWLKDSHTMKTLWNMQTESGREGRGVIRSEPLPLGGNSGVKGSMPGWWPALGRGRLEVHIECPPPGFWQRGKGPLGLHGGPVGPTGELWNAWTSPVRSTRMLACSRSGAERADGGAAWFPAPVPARDPIRASEHASPAHLTSQLHAGVRAATNKARAVLW